jgi:Fic family protein
MDVLEIAFLEHSNWIEGVYDSQSFDDAVVAWEYLKKFDERISPQTVLNTHKRLMKNQKIPEKDKGNFRTQQVWVGGREGIKYYYIPTEMVTWCWEACLTPKKWKSHHVTFEKIHPFIDGNGRIGRMLMNWERLKAKLPILVIKEEERGDYYKWFTDKK